MQTRSVLTAAVRAMISLAILALGVAGCLALVYRESVEATGPPPVEPQQVRTVAIKPHGGDLEIHVDGTVVPFREIKLAAEVSGRITTKAKVARAGSYVLAGAVLFRIDPRDYELQIKRLTSQLSQADSDLEELAVENANAEALLELADEELVLHRNELDRLQTLSRQTLSGNSIVTDSDLDRAKRAELSARNAQLLLKNQVRLLAARRNRFDSARELVAADLEKAALDLERTEITAPVDGVVVRDSVEQDAYVQVGTQLLTIEDTSAVEVACQLRGDELYWLWPRSLAQHDSPRQRYQLPPTPVTVLYELSGRNDVKYAWQGTLYRFDGIGLDRETRTAACRVLVQNPHAAKTIRSPASATPLAAPPALVRGMFVSVRLHVTPSTTLLRLPERAVRPGKSAWLVDSGRLQVRRSLQLIEFIERKNRHGEDESFWLVDGIASRLEAGQRVVVTPLVVARDGMQVVEQNEREVANPLGDS